MKRYIALFIAVLSLVASAQNIRYVSKSGKYANDGMSWENAKLNVQDAINDLVDNGLTGEVWVATGTYTPTESTEQSGGNTLYMSFKIPAGITVRGGFLGNESKADERERLPLSTVDWYYKNQTILSGNLSTEAKFTWNSTKQVYETTFYGNCYHVVWFAMNGFDADGRARALDTTKGNAVLEGCTITGGNAYNNSLSGRQHNAYGGGAYMVRGSEMQNCYVTHCEASRDGGGVYMDGGGVMTHVYVAECQALGIGVANGFGGGVCADENAQSAPVVIRRSGVTNCVGRMGGGIAVNVHNQAYRNLVAMQSVLVSNNTATTEGGGVYCYQGGSLTQMTVVNNRCNGSGVNQNGMVTGRSAGIYVRDYAIIANTVMWGGKCEANNDIQYAVSRSGQSDEKPFLSYSFLSNADYVDWSGVTKQHVRKLSVHNTSASGSASVGEGYAMFDNPSENAGYVPNGGLRTIHDVAEGRAYSWQPTSRSAMAQQGIVTRDLDVTGKTPATEHSYDILGKEFPSHSTVGAYTSAAVSGAFYEDGDGYHLFIDPNENKGVESLTNGQSWDTPGRLLEDCFRFIEARRADGSIDASKHVYVHVKEGTIDNASAKAIGRVRMVSISLPTNCTILGGYSPSLTGYDRSVRNPLLYPTIITAEIMDDYKYNAAHLLRFDGLDNVTFDGFQIRYANASSTALSNDNKDGAGMTFTNCTNITVRNVIVSHCTAEKGAAVYANNSTISFENCIFHNNATSKLIGTGVIYGIGGSHLTFDHCDVLRNVGYASYLDGTTTNVWTNSIFYANFREAVDDSNTDHAEGHHDLALPAFAGTTVGATGHHCFFDWASEGFQSQFGGNDTGNEWQYNLQYKFAEGSGKGYPRFINPTKNVGVSTGGDMTYYGRATSFEPHNNNPIVNEASVQGTHDTWGTDCSATVTRDYGGLPDVGAVENHAATVTQEGENAYQNGQPAYGSLYYVRDYRNGDGTIDYSRGGDGSSWDNAINGNAYYSTSTGAFMGASRSKEVTYWEDEAVYTETPGTGTNSPTCSTIASPTYIRLSSDGHYLKYGSGTFSSVDDFVQADKFVIISGLYLYDVTAGKYVTYTTSGTGNALTATLSLSDNQPSNKWTVSNGMLYYRNTYNPKKNQTYYKFHYLTLSGGTLSVTSTDGSAANSPVQSLTNVWTFTPTIRQATGETTPVKKTKTVTDGLNGLQFAVNMAGESYKQDHIRKDVYVAAGTYAKDPETGDESCFMIRDGVNVYGAFPATGNPCMDEREALVSQYVKVHGGYLPSEFETILEPITKTIQTGVTRRVLGQAWESNPRYGQDYPTMLVRYEGALWDGFTLRNGVLDAATLKSKLPNRDGGAGAAIYENVTLRNVVVTRNITLYNNPASDKDFRAGGVYMDGGVLEGVYVIDNTLTGWNPTTSARLQRGAAYGGGMYLYSGTVFNSVVANNNIYATYADGAGIFIENAKFFNNTVVNNKAEGTNRACGGIAIWTDVSRGGDTSHLYLINSIVLDNEGYKPGKIGNENLAIQNGGIMTLTNCMTSDITNETSGSNSITFTNCHTGSKEDLFVTPGVYGNDFATLDLRLKSDALGAINHGVDAPTIMGQMYDLSTYTDMDYLPRIQDCSIDIGAYEFNNAYAITPQINTEDGKTTAVYYVTPKGRGTASATNPENAACADKLQKVLDAAGRYKYQNPETQVIVKCATYANGTDFQYYATRSTDEADQDVRVWSIIVPRGVEVWGGYTDAYVSDTDHGFVTRDVLNHPTRFDGYYYNRAERNDAYCYHVLTFTEHVFDGNGVAYRRGDTVGENSTMVGNDDLMMMSDAGAAVGRAVVDGIFVSGGNANIQVAGGGQTVNINEYGGAAIVTDFAHIRNCVLRNNNATYGGALAMTSGGLVSGTLIDQNTAEYGGGIYVFENNTKLSDGTVINTTAPVGQVMDFAMPHVVTSTIVNNMANRQGGGMWFGSDEANVRVNSSVIWQNNCQDQANVAGLTNPEKAENDQTSSLIFYPFSYSAVQNVRLSGASNLSLGNENKQGARFVQTTHDAALHSPGDQKTLALEGSSADFSKFDDFGFYGLTNYSVLTRTGMPVDFYKQLATMYGANVSMTDLAGVDRIAATHLQRSYLDIGARALDKEFVQNQMMLRIYVAEPIDIDMDAAQAMMSLPEDNYYSQEGSSFAFPMQSLQDALDYIYTQRQHSTDSEHPTYANNLPFEIVMSRGNYYPTRDLKGSYGYSLSNSFAIPEGVSIYGGFFTTELGENTFYGRYHEPKNSSTLAALSGTTNVAENVTTLNEASVQPSTGYTIRQISIDEMMIPRDHVDLNANSIIEPWEFHYQTILNGNVENMANSGVYHVLTAVADENAVGPLPLPVSVNPESRGVENQYTYHEMGQDINLNGLQITGGFAHNFISNSMDEYSSYSYYHGGGLLVDGNRYADTHNQGAGATLTYQHTGVSNAVGCRNIPVIITKCRFNDNLAGYGGAISTNGSLEVFSSAFEKNQAVANTETVETEEHSHLTVAYPGQGGAIYHTHTLTCVNTLFANNEAKDETFSKELHTYPTLRVQSPSTKILGGCGGAIYGGMASHMHLINCDVVRNQANMYPSIFTMNPNYTVNGPQSATAFLEYNQFVNTVFWGNEVNPTMAGKYDSDPVYRFASRLICNYGSPTRDASHIGSYNPAIASGAAPASLTDLNTSFVETAWFSAYEEGRGMTQNNSRDLRDREFDPTKYLTANFGSDYQNSNITIDSENNTLQGPNFINPSVEAGVAGYVESADWAPARLNVLTDQGYGRLDQVIVPVGDKFKCDWVKSDGQYVSSGAYPMFTKMPWPEYRRNMPLGDDLYMRADYTNGETATVRRISFDPNPTHNQTYIDIGVYEYVHTELSYTTDGDEVDILWVSSAEKPDNGLPDGSDWTQPTSDLQRAIETLLASRNGHRKEIRLMDGTFTPIYTIDGHLSFYIDTRDLNNSVMLPVDGSDQPVYDLGVRSLTIKGGYSRDLNNQYDVDLYPAIIRGQNRTDGTGHTWDHVFYINDASQRLGMSNYTNENGWGWWKSASEVGDAPSLIPIEIDGVQIINSQALSGTKGAALYYADQTYNDEMKRVDGATYYEATAPASANISNVVYYTDESMTEESDVPTVYYSRADVKYYTDDTYETESPTPTAYYRYDTTGAGYVQKDSPAKFILSKSVIMGSGTHYAGGSTTDYTSSAVYLGQHGGQTLLYNNVFHSNYGSPLEAYAAHTVNNTFGQNWGTPVLHTQNGVPSTIFNSVFWQNSLSDPVGKQFDLEGYVDDATSGNIFAYNAYEGGDEEHTVYDEFESDGITHTPIYNHNYNVGLSSNNSDVIYGPNFVDPLNADIEARSFRLQPSLRLLNKGKNGHYNDNLKDAAYSIYDLAWLTTTRVDADGNQRFFASSIDLGAYEYQNALDRILYVDPNQAVSGLGTSWESPLGYGNIQDAIDLAGVYHTNSITATNPHGEQAYVFVKGASTTNSGMHTGENLVFRGGVNVYGSVVSSYAETCPFTTDGNGVRQYENDKIDEYVDNLLAWREGVASPSASKTTVSTISTNGTGFTAGEVALMDGFDVMPEGTPDAQGRVAVTEPVINIAPLRSDGKQEAAGDLSVCLQNVIVHNCNMTTPSTSLVNVNNALLYEALMRDNQVASGDVLHLNQYGYAANVTVEGKTGGYAGFSDRVKNSLVNYAGDAATLHTFSGYHYAVEDANLNYQLAEKSKNIDACATTNPLQGTAVESTLGIFINYPKDHDLLGNPRLLTGVTTGELIDAGAFETWRVDNDFVCGTEGTVKGNPIAATFYPHDGSVVYIMEGNSLVIDPVDENDVKPTAHNPAYMLLQQGASCYGNGRPMTCSYLAIERSVDAAGDVVSMPYQMNYGSNVAVPTYDSEGVLTLTADAPNVFAYDATQRADWQYTFAEENSRCWKPVTVPVQGCEGVLYVPNVSTDVSGVLRFTGRGANMHDYVYTEALEAPYKSLTLVQHDDNEYTGPVADYTDADDMGWNCFGSPYLVANYETSKAGTLDCDTENDGTQAMDYTMSNARVMWEYYYTNQTDEVGRFRPINSWEENDGQSPVIILGEGVFTQTASFVNEELRFERPVYGSASSVKVLRHYDETSVEEQTGDMADVTMHVDHRTIHLGSLQAGDAIRIYDPSGQLYTMASATGEHYSVTLPHAGIYLVRVGNSVWKPILR